MPPGALGKGIHSHPPWIDKILTCSILMPTKTPQLQRNIIFECLHKSDGDIVNCTIKGKKHKSRRLDIKFDPASWKDESRELVSTRNSFQSPGKDTPKLITGYWQLWRTSVACMVRRSYIERTAIAYGGLPHSSRGPGMFS